MWIPTRLFLQQIGSQVRIRKYGCMQAQTSDLIDYFHTPNGRPLWRQYYSQIAVRGPRHEQYATAVSIAYDLKDDEAIRKLVKAGHGSAEASQQEAIVAAPGSQDARETVGSIGEDFAPKAPVDSSSVMEMEVSCLTTTLP